MSLVFCGKLICTTKCTADHADSFIIQCKHFITVCHFISCSAYLTNVFKANLQNAQKIFLNIPLRVVYTRLLVKSCGRNLMASKELVAEQRYLGDTRTNY